MSTVVYNYKAFDPKTGESSKIPFIASINCQVKLVVIDDSYNAEGGVVDSSLTFFLDFITASNS